MILLDSNIVIYLRDPDYSAHIAAQLQGMRIYTCNVVVSEVLGFGGLEQQDVKYFADLLESMKNLPFDQSITNRVVDMRRQIQIQLPDAIIAATAMVHSLELWTHNTKDFEKIPNLRLHDPLSKP